MDKKPPARLVCSHNLKQREYLKNYLINIELLHRVQPH